MAGIPKVDDYLPDFTVGEIQRPAPKKTAEPVDYYAKLSPEKKAKVDKEVELEMNPRGALGEVGAGFMRGATYELPRMVGQILKAPSKPGDNLYGAGKWVQDVTEGMGTKYMADPNEEHHNAVTRAFAEGASMVAPSVAPLLALPVMGAVGAPAAVGVGAAAVAGGLGFGAAQFQDTYEKAKAAGKTDAEARELGLKTGAAEGVGEGVGSAILGPFVKGAGNVAKRVIGRELSADEALNALRNPKFLPEFAKSLGEVAAVETGTEVAQAGAQAAIEKEGGISDVSAWDAATDAIGPALALTAILGPLGAVNLRRTQQRNKQLTEVVDNLDAPMHEVTAATRELADQMVPLVGREKANEWRLDALEANNARAAELTRQQDDASLAQARDADAWVDKTSQRPAPSTVPRDELDASFGLDKPALPAGERLARERGLYTDLFNEVDLRDNLISEVEGQAQKLAEQQFSAQMGPALLRATAEREAAARAPALPYRELGIPMGGPQREGNKLTQRAAEVEGRAVSRAQAAQDRWEGKAVEQNQARAVDAVDTWRSAAAAAGLDVSKLKGQNLARVTRALKTGDLDVIKAARDKFGKDTVGRDSLDAYVTSLETQREDAQRTAAQDQAGTEPQSDAVQAAAANPSGGEAAGEGAQAPKPNTGSAPQGEVAPKRARASKGSEEKIEYDFQLRQYRPKEPVTSLNNRTWLLALQDALNDANMVDEVGRPLKKTQSNVRRAQYAQQIIADLANSEKEGAQIHALSTQRLAQLVGSGKVSQRMRETTRARVASTRKAIRHEVVAAKLAQQNGRAPTLEEISDYELDADTAKEIARVYEAGVDQDARSDYELAASPSYRFDPGIETALRTGDVNTVLSHIAENGPSEWTRYMAKYLGELGLKTGIEMIPEVKRAAGGKNELATGPRVFGRYSHAANKVRIFVGGENAHTVIHEIVHAATVGRMRLAREAAALKPGQRTAEQRAAYADMLDLYDFFRSMKSASQGQYAFKNMEEFVAEAFSNESFQTWLAGQKYDGRSAWQKFVSWVMDVLGMRRNATSYPALEKALQSGFRFFEGSRFGAGEGLSFNHSATAAASATNEAGQALVAQGERFLDSLKQNSAVGNLGDKAQRFILWAGSKHHIEQTVTPELRASIAELRQADATKDSILDELHRGAVDVLKPLEQEMARYSIKEQGKLDRTLGRLMGLASQYDIDIRKNFDENKAAKPQLNDRLRTEINNLHSQYKALPQGMRTAAEETTRYSRKQYVRTTATFLASRINAYRNALGEETTNSLLAQLDFRDPTLAQGANPNPDLFTDAATANLDKRIQDVIASLSTFNPNSTVAEGGTSLGVELAEYAKAYRAQRDAPYLHLGRSGDFFVSFTLPRDLGGVGTVQKVAERYGLVVGTPGGDNRNAFARFDNKAKADAFYRDLATLGEGVTAGSLTKGSVSDRGSAESMHGASRVAQQILRTIDSQDFSPGVTEEMRRFVKRTVLDMAPDTSARNVLQARNDGGTAGFDSSFVRNFSKSAEMHSSMLANLYTMPKYDAAFANMRDTVRGLESGEKGTQAKNVFNELQRRHANTLSPVESPGIDRFKAFGYNFYLAMSPAFILTNTMQPYHLTLPYLGGRYGFVPAFKEMKSSTAKAISVLKATLAHGVKEGKEKGGWKGGVIGALDLEYVLDKSGLRPDEVDFIKRLQASGELSAMQAVELGQLAQGDSRVGMLAAKIASAGSQYTEVVNRISSGLAGYNLERNRSGNVDQAAAKGIAAVRDTQYNYTDRNTGRAFGRHGAFGKATPLLTSFMNYNLQTMELLWREARVFLKSSGATKEEKAQAAKTLGGIFATTSLLAGTLGLPLTTAVAALADRMLGSDDDPSDVKSAYREWLAEIFGKDVAEAIARGVPRAVLGFDLSSRAGMQDLLPGSRFMADRRDMKEKLESGSLGLLGPAAGAVSDILAGYSALSDGRILDALTEALPLALRGAAKSAKLGTEGFTNSTGNKLPIEVTPWDMVVQAAGFTPSKKAEQSEVNFAFKQTDMQLRAAKAKLANKLYRAIERGEDTTDIMQDVLEFNTRNPQYRIEPKRALETRAKARGVAEVSGTDITTLPRMLPLLEKYKFANTQ